MRQGKKKGRSLAVLLLGLFGGLISCQRGDAKLELALRLAGDNRGELERVLGHYSREEGDSLKLRAAYFLIENMPGHYSLEGAIMDKCRKRIYEDTTASYFSKKAVDVALCTTDMLRRVSERQPDVEVVTADDLISHIDRSFEHMERYPWLREIPFEVFLEEVLPYRFAEERLNLWIDSLGVREDELERLDVLDEKKYSVWSTDWELGLTNDERVLSRGKIIEYVRQDIRMDCQYLAYMENLRNRAAGMPSSVDFIPCYASRNGNHYWCKRRSLEVKDLPVERQQDRRVAKIYRKSYAHQRIVVPVRGEFMPEFFRNPFHKDVTNEYLYTADVEIPVAGKRKVGAKFAYVCVFSSLKWIPVDMGVFRRKGARFRNMGLNVVYLPVVYEGQKMRSFNYPFVLNLDGQMEYLIPDTTRRQTLCLTRKYPAREFVYEYNRQMENVYVEADDNPHFKTPVMMAERLDVHATYATQEIDTKRAFRYWRVEARAIAGCAEIVFQDERGEVIKGEIDSAYVSLFDNDPLTAVDLGGIRSVVVDFGKPVRLGKVVCVPRGDGNAICPGDEYELFYYDLNGWQSLGRKVAMHYELDYENVPEGALYWLHDRTTGVEERVFTLEENGEIRFW